MGKAAKEHRKKVAKRNVKIQQKKSAMQKAFDTLLKAQMDQVLNKENTKIELSGKTMEFEILEDRIVDDVVQLQLNPEESAKINKEFEPEYDSAGYTIEDRELPTEE